ncbi:lysine 2,3-aminomutase, partial [Paraburkholderia sp. BR14264]
ARTVRGPSMSAFPGKVVIDGIVDIAGEKVFALQFLQARKPEWVRRPFYAKFDPNATWLHDLVPAFGEQKFFFETEADAPHKSLQLVTRHTGRYVPGATSKTPQPLAIEA